MLLKSKISKIKILSDEWHESRLGKLTSSEIHFICDKTKLLTSGATTYLHRKVGELLTGKSIKFDIDTDATRWGAVEEANAIMKFGQWKKLEFVVCQQLITEEGGRVGSTPDGLIVNRESSCGTMYDVSNVEVKCPPTYHNYISLALCETPQDLRSENKQYYWQVIDQMLECDAMVAYFIAYHPEFKSGNMRIIEFRKMLKVGDGYPIVNDLNFLKKRKAEAIEYMDSVKEKLIEIGTI